MKNTNSFKQALFTNACLIVLLVVPLSSALAQENEVQKPQLDIQRFFTASGYMGDGEYGTKYIEFDGAYEMDPHSAPTCIRIKYTFGSQRWGGIYWQNKPDNWGDMPGNKYSIKGFSKVTFWAKGATGKETVEFKTGDIYNASKKFHDSFSATTGRFTLSQEWAQYELDLEGADLSSVIGGFAWVASIDYNSQDSIVFYIDDIYFE